MTWPASLPSHYTSLSRATGVSGSWFTATDWNGDKAKFQSNYNIPLQISRGAASAQLANTESEWLSLATDAGADGILRPRDLDTLVKSAVGATAYPWPADYPYFDGSDADESRRLWRTELLDHVFRACGVLYQGLPSASLGSNYGYGWLEADVSFERNSNDFLRGAYHNVDLDTNVWLIPIIGHSVGAYVLNYSTGILLSDDVAFAVTNQEWWLFLHCIPRLPGSADRGRTFKIGYVVDGDAASDWDTDDDGFVDDDADVWDVLDGTLASGLSFADMDSIAVNITPALSASSAAGKSALIKIFSDDDPTAAADDTLVVDEFYLWTFFTDSSTPSGYPA